MRTLLVSLKLAWVSLNQNKVRSALTLLGMVIGVGAVIAIVSLGEGLRADFEQQISSLGGDVFYMTPSSTKRPGRAPKMPELFKMDDMEAIKRECPLIKRVVAGIQAGVSAKYRDKQKDCNVLGVEQDYLEQDPSNKLDTGRFFTKADMMFANRVVVIGSDLSDELFGGSVKPVGQTIKLSGISYEIVGKLKKRTGSFAGGPDVNNGFMAPVSTVQKRMLGSEDVFWVSLYLAKGAEITEAKDQVSQVMRQRRRIRNVSDDDFQFISPDDFLKLGNQFLNVLIGVFGAIAFISLLVGGVGIMNIMLVSVTERTREIGLRMAVGANRQALLNQFLTEAVVLTLTGGVIGLLTGYLGAFGISFALQKALQAQWSPHIPPVWVAYAIGVSVLVGVIFGVYPAFKASQLDPVEAMRYE
jgi:putative ABC transport system permease protein